MIDETMPFVLKTRVNEAVKAGAVIFAEVNAWEQL